MKNLKQILTLVLLAVFMVAMPSFVSAQSKGKGKGKGKSGEQHGKSGEQHGNSQKTAEQRAKGRTNGLTNKLGLSTEQSQKTYEVLLTTIQKMDEIKKMAKGEERKNLVNDIQAKKDEAFRNIFNREQYAKYVQMKEDRKKNHDKAEDDEDDDDNVQTMPKSDTPVKANKGKK
jgi:Spy/CpxP family protein refolding chaperone